MATKSMTLMDKLATSELRNTINVFLVDKFFLIFFLATDVFPEFEESMIFLISMHGLVNISKLGDITIAAVVKSIQIDHWAVL